MSKDYVLGVDFDGTIVEHEYPQIGPEAPFAFEWLKKFQSLGIRLVLFTMRSGVELNEAVTFCQKNGIEFYGINVNPTQKTWTNSPKAYCQNYIDDASIGCPLVKPFLKTIGRPYVNWKLAGPKILKAHKEHCKKYGN
jgi:hypothetical protein